MFSSLLAVKEWAATTFDMEAATYPQAKESAPFIVINRTGGECRYPHDFPSYGLQFWTTSDLEGETLAFECSTSLESLLEADERINAVGVPTITQLGLTDGGLFIWEIGFDLSTTIRE